MTRRARVALAVIVLLVAAYGGRRWKRRSDWKAAAAQLAARDALAATVVDARGALEVLAYDHEIRRAPNEDLPAIHRVVPPPYRRLTHLPEGRKTLHVRNDGDIAVVGATTQLYDLMTAEPLPPRAISDEVLPGNAHFDAAPDGNDVVLYERSAAGVRRPMKRLHGHTGPVTLTAIAGYAPVGPVYFASTAADHTVRLWSYTVTEAIVVIDVDLTPATLYLAPDATRILVADEANEDIRIYDVTLDAAVKELCRVAANAPAARTVCP